MGEITVQNAKAYNGLTFKDKMRYAVQVIRGIKYDEEGYATNLYCKAFDTMRTEKILSARFNWGKYFYFLLDDVKSTHIPYRQTFVEMFDRILYNPKRDEWHKITGLRDSDRYLRCVEIGKDNWISLNKLFDNYLWANMEPTGERVSINKESEIQNG